MILLRLRIIVKKERLNLKIGEKFSLESIAPKYEKFFTDVVNVHEGQGWYSIDDISIYDEQYLADNRGLNSDGTPLVKKNQE